MYNRKKRDNLSRFMSFMLRHKPEQFGLVLNKEGYCPLDTVVETIQKDAQWKDVTVEHVLEVVKECPKQRYEILDGSLIRARYGHSAMKVEYEEETPPEFLLHGTSKDKVDVILSEGIKSMNRKYVHLSETTHFSSLSGKRHGELLLLSVDTAKAKEMGVTFYFAGGEVWLTEFVPPEYLTVYKG